MSTADHVATLKAHRYQLAAAGLADKVAAIDAGIAALEASKPESAEAVVYQVQDRATGFWIDSHRTGYELTLERGGVARAIYTAPPRPEASDRKPDGYAYRYPGIWGTEASSFIRHNNGGEVNGVRPIEAIPYFYGAPQQASAPVGVEALLQRIDAAIERVTTGRAAMRVPADLTDPDLVLADARNWIKQAALAQQPAAVDEAVGTVTRVGSFEVQEHRIELDPEFDERLNSMPEGAVVRLYAAPVRDLTQQQLAAASAALAGQQQGDQA